MKRREFFKTGLSLGAVVLTNRTMRSLISAQNDISSNQASYLPGQKISPGAFVLDSQLKRHALLELCKKSAAKVVVFYIYGGGVTQPADRLGGIWCPDSFEDLYIVRYIYSKYSMDLVRLVPIACPPVYSSRYYGFEERVFLDEPEDSQVFKDSTKTFVEDTERIIQNGYLPVSTYYDIRFRLLFNMSKKWKPGKGYGMIYPWQGNFRRRGEAQKYGTPTLWLLNNEGEVLTDPFSGNIYQSEPYQIRYTVLDVDQAIRDHL